MHSIIRVGAESDHTFYGSSFIVGPEGQLAKIADRESEGVLVETFDLDTLQQKRAAFGLLRDRRPSLYKNLSQ